MPSVSATATRCACATRSRRRGSSASQLPDVAGGGGEDTALGEGLVLIRADDLAHQPVPHNVGFVQIVKRDSVDVAQDPLDLQQPGIFASCEIDLSLVAGNDRF